MSFPTDLVHFVAAEFKHPDLMDPAFLYFLDAVRTRYGSPLVITSDARTLEQEVALPKHAEPAESSLHVAWPLARAVDLAWIGDPIARWNFHQAVVDTAKALNAPVELEYEFPGEPHIHLGLFRDSRPSHLELTFLEAS
jgi:hypothetical protein